MASTTKTTNLELSQFVGTDKPAWLTDYNGDMQKIDDGYKKLEDANTATQADLDATKQDLSGSQSDINDVKASVQALEAQDIALGNRLTVVEGNYDTMHHEVAINQKDIANINNALPNKVNSNINDGGIFFGENNFSFINNVKPHNLDFRHTETIAVDYDTSNEKLKTILIDAIKDNIINRFASALDIDNNRHMIINQTLDNTGITSESILAFPLNGFIADVDVINDAVELTFKTGSDSYYRLLFATANKQFLFMKNDGTGETVLFSIQGV